MTPKEMLRTALQSHASDLCDEGCMDLTVAEALCDAAKRKIVGGFTDGTNPRILLDQAMDRADAGHRKIELGEKFDAMSQDNEGAGPGQK